MFSEFFGFSVIWRSVLVGFYDKILFYIVLMLIIFSFYVIEDGEKVVDFVSNGGVGINFVV